MADAPGAELPHPREREVLIGHADATHALADAYGAGRLHHAWLIGGPVGTGKATLAYRFARFLLASPAERRSRDGDPLAVEPTGRTFRQIAVSSHPNLLVIERGQGSGDKAAPKTIPVDTVRRVVSFFGTTAADGGHRVCIVDSLDELNVQGANALLKIVEEPPPRSTLLILSHAPQRALATIRSRCRKLNLSPLSEEEVGRVLSSLRPALGQVEADTTDRAAAMSGGSVQRALALLDPRRLALLEDTRAILSALPREQSTRVLGLADRLADRAVEELPLVVDAVQGWLTEEVRCSAARGVARLAPLADVCEKIVEDARALDAFNLDRRAFVVTMFRDLAEAIGRAGPR